MYSWPSTVFVPGKAPLSVRLSLEGNQRIPSYLNVGSLSEGTNHWKEYLKVKKIIVLAILHSLH